MGKLLYSWIIQKDRAIPNTLVRTSTIPEELGRIEYIMSDKTGTLTKNDMVRALKLLSMLYCTKYSLLNNSLFLDFQESPFWI